MGAYDAISSPETLRASADVVEKLGGGKLVKVLPPPAEGLPGSVKTVSGKAFGVVLILE